MLTVSSAAVLYRMPRVRVSTPFILTALIPGPPHAFLPRPLLCSLCISSAGKIHLQRHLGAHVGGQHLPARRPAAHQQASEHQVLQVEPSAVPGRGAAPAGLHLGVGQGQDPERVRAREHGGLPPHELDEVQHP